eukprot:scaffold135107_cov49-Attheya_sp.AAC.4
MTDEMENNAMPTGECSQEEQVKKRKKKKSKKRKKDVQDVEMQESETSGDNGSVPLSTILVEDEDDNELLAAAGAWARQNEDVPSDVPSENSNEPTAIVHPMSTETSSHMKPPAKLSLHITQLPFEASEAEIRQAFVTKGCRISSLRLVYDFNPGYKKNGGDRKKFRGVAFLDVMDKDSYEKALALHSSKLFLDKGRHRGRFGGRKVNVRPTRTKEELTQIVQHTKDKLAALRRATTDVKDSKPLQKGQKDEAQSKRKRKNENSSESKPKSKRRAESDASDKRRKVEVVDNLKPTVGKGKDPAKKLTKKERAKKAAVLLSKGR